MKSLLRARPYYQLSSSSLVVEDYMRQNWCDYTQQNCDLKALHSFKRNLWVLIVKKETKVCHWSLATKLFKNAGSQNLSLAPLMAHTPGIKFLGNNQGFIKYVKHSKHPSFCRINLHTKVPLSKYYNLLKSLLRNTFIHIFWLPFKSLLHGISKQATILSCKYWQLWVTINLVWKMNNTSSVLFTQRRWSWIVWCTLFLTYSSSLSLTLNSISIVFPRVFYRLLAPAGVTIEVSLLTGVTWAVRGQASASPFSSTLDTQ